MLRINSDRKKWISEVLQHAQLLIFSDILILVLHLHGDKFNTGIFNARRNTCFKMSCITVLLFVASYLVPTGPMENVFSHAGLPKAQILHYCCPSTVAHEDGGFCL